MARSAQNILFAYPDMRLEYIIAELIDNSLDYNADCIDVYIHPIGNGEYGLIVMDNGDGFSDKSKMFDAMEIESDVVRPDGTIGSFHVGMKLSPIVMFPECSLVTKINQSEIFINWSNPGTSGIPYDMDAINPQNPTEPKDFNLGEIHWNPKTKVAFNKMKSRNPDWTTAVVCHVRDTNVLLLFDDIDPDSLSSSNKYSTILQRFLGMVYQERLEHNENLKINILDNHSSRTFTVKPIDPFCRALTPKKLSELKTLLAETDYEYDIDKRASEETIDRIERFAKFGTVEGPEHRSEDLPEISTQVFVIPDKTARGDLDKCLANTPDAFHYTEPLSKMKIPGSGSLFASENLAGMYIYQNGRLLHMGEFRNLKRNANNHNAIRIKITLDSNFDSERSHIKISPNKNKIRSISDEVMGAILDGLLRQVGGPQYAAPFDERKPMYNGTRSTPRASRGGIFQQNDEHWANVEARGSRIKYVFCQNCQSLHIPSIGELCPLVACLKCKQTGSGCTGLECTYTCPRCDRVGDHHLSNCTMPCPECGVTHRTNECPVPCQDCEEIMCVCCPTCGRQGCNQCCTTCESQVCICSEVGNSPVHLEFPLGETFAFDGPLSGNREILIQKVKELLERLNISIEELRRD